MKVTNINCIFCNYLLQVTPIPVRPSEEGRREGGWEGVREGSEAVCKTVRTISSAIKFNGSCLPGSADPNIGSCQPCLGCLSRLHTHPSFALMCWPLPSVIIFSFLFPHLSYRLASLLPRWILFLASYCSHSPGFTFSLLFIPFNLICFPFSFIPPFFSSNVLSFSLLRYPIFLLPFLIASS